MPKTAAGAILGSLIIDKTASLPAFRQLFVRLQQAMIEGHLPAGTRLPSSRVLAKDLGLGRNTVIQAYELLADEGYLEGRVGDGSYVSDQLAAPSIDSPRRSTKRAAGAPGLSERGSRLSRAADPPRASPSGPLAVGVPALDLFPLATWRRLVSRQLSRHGPDLLRYGDPAGRLNLRAAIARHLATARGVRCSAEQVLIFAGAQEALGLAARMLMDPGDRAWLEEPAYPGVRGAVIGAGAIPVPVPVDEEGLRVEAGHALAPDAKAAFVTPSHQFPLGMTMSLRRRLELIEWTAASGAFIVEDDYDSEFRLTGRPIGALQGILPDRVIYVGTFSKALFPSLRLAYAVVPDPLVGDFLAARGLQTSHPPSLDQAVVADFIDGGHFATHIRKMVAAYSVRREMVEAELADPPSNLSLLPSRTGLHATALLREGQDSTLADRAALEGIELPTLSPYYLGSEARQGVLIGYGSTPPDALRAALRRVTRLAMSSAS